MKTLIPILALLLLWGLSCCGNSGDDLAGIWRGRITEKERAADVELEVRVNGDTIEGELRILPESGKEEMSLPVVFTRRDSSEYEGASSAGSTGVDSIGDDSNMTRVMVPRIHDQAPPFDAIIGPMGHPIQLVVNFALLRGVSGGLVPAEVVTLVQEMPGVKLVAPICVGDNFRGWPVVAATSELFEGTDPGKGWIELAEGRLFVPEAFEVVLGATVCQQEGMSIGQTLQLSHGVSGHEPHSGEFKVVGVLRPNGTAFDRAVMLSIERFYRLDGHALRNEGKVYHPKPGEPIPTQFRAVSAVFVRLGLQPAMKLQQRFRDVSGVSLAYPLSGQFADLVHHPAKATAFD